ncbi:hypothetical protein DYB37_002342 [Aphanomyces astaci]|uniref:DNA polymerase delta/zeta catalytic subunit N-terminal domain-containing protein n=1 Tax=Aphanomyces astaci TaxID=112090 RepID=A0A3L6V8C3_APHAT|nr:hypothetical protein DYB35_003839 [Aphanomyces astaci]RHZ04452.1 hypothetical protein DYB37_002342 [Aphanomyces astaci]RLO05085.1 hypothetical protein DYB28_002266 [Aphanomyces astaci]
MSNDPIPHTSTKLAVVKGVPFYGYHASEVLFIKVFLYDPAMMSRIVQVVESGLVTQRTFQPYEAHIPYLLQVPVHRPFIRMTR